MGAREGTVSMAGSGTGENMVVRGMASLSKMAPHPWAKVSEQVRVEESHESKKCCGLGRGGKGRNRGD